MPEGQTSGELLGSSFGQGFGSGISQGLQNALNAHFQEKQRVEKGRPQVLSAFSSMLKLFDPNKAFDENTRKKVYDQAIKTFESTPGMDPLSAVNAAFESLRSQEEQIAQSKPQTPGSLEGLGEDVLTAGAKMSRPLVGLADLAQRGGSFLGDLAQRGIQSIRGLTPEQIQSQQEKAKELPKPLLKKSLLQEFDKLTGGRGIIPESTSDNMFQNINNAIQRVVSASSFGIPGVVAETGSEIAKSAGFGEIGQLIASLGGFAAAVKSGVKLEPVFDALAKQLKRTPTAAKSIQQAATVAAIPEEEVVAKAAENLEKRGVNVLKAGDGDPATLNELQKEVNKVSKTFQSAEKESVKDLQKVRADVAKKLPESPLEKYYAPPKESVKKPETIAKDELRNAPLRTQIHQNERRLKNLQYEILNTRSALKEAQTLGPQAVERLNSKLALDTIAHEKTLNEIKNLNFEIKHGRRPQSTEDIQKQISETFTKLREGIKNPSAEKVEEFRKGFERDRAAISQAEKLVARGEIPGKEVFDEFIKVHQEYNKAYKDLIKELGDFIKDNKGNKKLAKQIANAESLQNVVKDALKAGEAKVINQVDKRRAMRAIDKPSGAFYRQMLRDLRKDVDAFQKDFFKWKQIASPEEAKTAKIAGEKLAAQETKPAIKLESAEKIAKDAEKAAKNPSQENISKIANETNASKEEIKDFMGKMKDGWKEAADKVKKGTATEKDIQSLGKQVLASYKKLPRISQALISGLLVGTIQGLGEQYLDFKPTQGQIGLLATAVTPSGLKVRLGAGAIAPVVYKYIRDAFEYSEAKKLKKLRNTSGFNNQVRSIKERYSISKANRIIKKSVQ